MGTKYNIATGGFSCGQENRLEGLTKDINITTITNLYVTEDVSEPTDNSSKDGSVNLLIDGGTKPYSIIWSDGFVGPSRNSMDIGEYGYTVKDFYGDMTHSGTIIFDKKYVEEVIETEIQEEVVEEILVIHDDLCLTNKKVNYLFTHDYNNGFRWINEEHGYIIDYVQENKRWEILNWDEGLLTKNSGLEDKVPTGTDWNCNGKMWSVTKGECKEIEDYLTLSVNNETCQGYNNGSVAITVNSINENTNYSYRIKGVSPYPSYTESRVFNNLGQGDYIVEAVDGEKYMTSPFTIKSERDRRFIEINLNSKVTQGDITNRTIDYTISSESPIPENLDVNIELLITYTKEYNCPNNEDGCVVDPIFNLEGFELEEYHRNEFTECDGNTTKNIVKEKGFKNIKLTKQSNTHNHSITHSIDTFDYTWANCRCRAYTKSKIEIIISNVTVSEDSCIEITHNGSINNDIYLQNCINQ